MNTDTGRLGLSGGARDGMGPTPPLGRDKSGPYAPSYIAFYPPAKDRRCDLITGIAEHD